MNWHDMTQDQRRNTLNAMYRHGDPSIKKLTIAWRFGGGEWQQRLADAFPELVMRYGPGSGYYAEEAIVQEAMR